MGEFIDDLTLAVVTSQNNGNGIAKKNGVPRLSTKSPNAQLSP